MKNNVCTVGEKMIIYIPKEVDHCFADDIRDVVDRKLQMENIKQVEFDFRGTEFMDSSGIGLLMGRYKLIRALGGSATIVHAGERIRKVLTLSGIHKIIPIEGEV